MVISYSLWTDLSSDEGLTLLIENAETVFSFSSRAFMLHLISGYRSSLPNRYFDSHKIINQIRQQYMYFSEWLFFANCCVHSKWWGRTQISTVGPEKFYSTGTDHMPISQHTSHLCPTLPVRWVRIFCHACADGWFSEMEPIEYSWTGSAFHA